MHMNEQEQPTFNILNLNCIFFHTPRLRTDLKRKHEYFLEEVEIKFRETKLSSGCDYRKYMCVCNAYKVREV